MINQIRTYIQNTVKGRKGSAMAELIVSIMLLLILFSGLIMSCVYVCKYFGCVYTLRSAVRTIEGLGYVEQGYVDTLTNDLENAGLENVDIQIQAGFVEDNKIQLRDEFILSLNATYPFKLCTFSDNEININLPVDARIKGRSEVYWKP